MQKRLILAVATAVVLAACTTAVDEPTTTTEVSASTTIAPEPATPVPTLTGLIAPPVRHAAVQRPIYFVMTD